MKIAFIFVFTVVANVLCFGEVKSDPSDPGITIVASITFNDFQLVERAVEIAKNNLPINDYRISIVSSGGEKGIVFTHKDTHWLQRGSPAVHPTFEVVFNDKGEILRSGFAR